MKTKVAKLVQNKGKMAKMVKIAKITIFQPASGR